MPVTVATSFLVISLNALVRPNPRHRDAALLFARSRGDDEDSSDGDRDSDSDSDSDSEEGVPSRRPFPPTTYSTASQTRTGGIMSTSQTNSPGGGIAGPTGTTIAFGNHTMSTTSSSITTTPSPTLSFTSLPESFSLSTSATSNNSFVPPGTSSNSNVRISNGAIIGMTLGIVFLGALIWMIILKMVKRKRRARKLPRGFIPSTILVDSQSFRGSVTELPVAPSTTTTGSSLTSSSRVRLSLSPFAALRIGSPSPPPSNPPPPPGLSGLALRRSSQQTSSSSYHTTKPMSTLSSHPEERMYPEQDPLYLAVPPPPPPATGPRGNTESAPSPAMSSVQTGMPTTYTSYNHPYRISTGFQQREYDEYYDEEDRDGQKSNSHRDPPPSYGMAF
ncbi:hypothetical protein FA13DRAFT_1726360 [Coprinellus micaceus]|uniref:Mid2 domain-containing protein n=1 Tax=Coprinellus micaceus TaxID=71717 RepID=A0A4Y7TUN8_COPMI|nr:hypothetical protein FA13DRAFT_1726360 [Coprinellus micaceus]